MEDVRPGALRSETPGALRGEEEVARSDFLRAVFELAARYEFSANAAAMAVKVGDVCVLKDKALYYSQALAEICAYAAGGFYEECGFEEILEDWLDGGFAEALRKVFSACGHNMYTCMTLIDVMTEVSGREASLTAAFRLACSPAHLAISPRTWLLLLPSLLRRERKTPVV